MSRSQRESNCPCEKYRGNRLSWSGADRASLEGQCLPLSRLIGRTLLKPLLVSWSSNDVDVFDRFLLQLLHNRGLADSFGTDLSPFICLTPFRPIFVDSTSTAETKTKTMTDTTRSIWQISPDAIRLYVEDLIQQPALLENFIVRTRGLGLTELRCSVVQEQLSQILNQLDLAVTDDLLRLISEERNLRKEKRRQLRCAAAARQRRTSEPEFDLTIGGRRLGPATTDECLPRCEDLIVIGIAIGKRRLPVAEDRDAAKPVTDDDLQPGRGKGKDGRERKKTHEEGDGPSSGIRPRTLPSLASTGEATLLIARPGRRQSQKSRKKKTPMGDGSGETGGVGGKGKGGKDKKGKIGRKVVGEDDDYDEQEDVQSDADTLSDDGGWFYGDEEIKAVDIEDDDLSLALYHLGLTGDEPRMPPANAMTRRSFLLGKDHPRRTMYSLEFTPAFVFSYFPTMPPHYFDKAELPLLLAKGTFR